MKQLKLSELDFHILNTRNPEPHQIELVEKAFRFWQNSWQGTFDSLGLGHKLYADDFLDREAMALFSNGEPVALFFNSWFDLRESQLNHSYFKNYPSDVIAKMRELKLKRTMILSYMTCDPRYRKSFTDVPMAELLFSLGVLRFQGTRDAALFGYIRKDLSFHRVFANHGGQLICESNVYNCPVDYLYMTQETATLSPIEGVAETANHLWAKAFTSKIKVA